MKTSKTTAAKTQRRGGDPDPDPIHNPRRRGVAFRDLPGVTVRLTPDAAAVLRDLETTGRGWLPREVLAQAVFNLGVECFKSDDGAGRMEHLLTFAPRQGWILTRGRVGADGAAVRHLPDGYNPDAKRERKAAR